MTDIDLGFPAECESEWLTNCYFPSKVGGKPAWLDLELPSNEDLLCSNCKGMKSFLCQIYAPYDDEHNFHRTIFVFICRSATCQKSNSSENITVLRSQLPRKNEYYAEEPPSEDGDPIPPILGKKKLCFTCGCFGSMVCSRCKKAHYCSVNHQRAHWSVHKKVCFPDSTEDQIKTSSSTLNPDICFPEWEIVIESNKTAVSALKLGESEDDEEKKQLNEFENLATAGKIGELANVSEKDLEMYAQNSKDVDDNFFQNFKNEIKIEPEQIIRYKRDGKPLWIADVETTVANQLQIPKCDVCGSERQFEFQIMPQMLLLLKDERLDWGVLSVYTCARSCKPPTNSRYIKEYVIKQDIIEK